MKLLGSAYSPRSPMDAVKLGVGFVPEDRKSQGLISAFTISENLSLPNYDLVSTARMWLNAARETSGDADGNGIEDQIRRSRAGGAITSAAAISRKSCWPNGWRKTESAAGGRADARCGCWRTGRDLPGAR